MTAHKLFALALAGVLALPAAAQQSSSSSSQPATTTPATSSPQASPAPSSPISSEAGQPAATAPEAKAQAETATGNAPLEPRKEGFWGHLNPFARKKYIQKEIDPVRDRLNELDELTAKNGKMIKDADARATEGIRLASAKANEADQHALEAGSRAQLASQTADQASHRLDTVQSAVKNIDQYQTSSQLEIIFKPGQTVLSKKSKDALDEMAEPLKNQKGYIVEVQAFSSGAGQTAIASSQAMADSVVRYLVLNNDIPVYRIYRVAMGNAPLPPDENGKSKRIHGGKVEISLLKNETAELQGEPAAPMSSAAQQPSKPAPAAVSSAPQQ